MKISTNEIVSISSEDTYIDDKFNRKVEVENLISLVSKLSQPCTIAIDSSWGTGKTTFLRFLQAELKKKNIKVSYFNAWENDFDKEPFLLILKHIIEQFSEKENNTKELKKIGLKVLKSITVNGSKALVNTLLPLNLGDEILEFANAITLDAAEEIFDTLTKEEQEIINLQKKLTLLIGQNNKLVILIDELDRSKPRFSVELLERIKHIFNTPNIIFILATDLDQLGKAVSGVYGESYDGRKYLDRFFDFEFNLTTPNYITFWHSLVNTYTGHSDIKCLDIKANILEYGIWISHHLNLSARDIKRLYTNIYLSSLSTYAGNNLPLIILLNIIKYLSKSAYENLKKGMINIEEIFELLSLKDLNFNNSNNQVVLKFILLIYNLLSTYRVNTASSEIINTLKEELNRSNTKIFFENFIEMHKNNEEFLIIDLESIYKAVDLQSISHKDIITVSRSIGVQFGQTTVASN